MKNFYTKNMKLIHKFLLNQIALSLFGFMTIMSMSSFGRTAMYVTTVFAVLFFAALLYDNAWDEGARDRNKISNGRLNPRPFHGVKLALFSYIPTLLFLIPLLILSFISILGVNGLDTVISIFKAIVIFIPNGMYLGFSYGLPDIFPETQCFFYVLYLIPAVVAYGLGYYLGTEDKQIKCFFGMAPTTDEPKKKK